MTELPWANKKMGQHFLKDDKIIQTICHDYASQASAIIEVGSGPGILTSGLASHHKPIICIEKDSRMREYLDNILTPDQLVMADALFIDLPYLLQQKQFPANDIWLVSNLPYNVSVPLLLKFIQVPSITFMTLMIQKEVGERILPSLLPRKEQKNGMNSLHALVGTWFDIKLAVKVPPRAFVPPPKVDSVVLSFNKRTAPALPLGSYHPYEAFLRKMFQHRRKQLAGVLRTSFPLTDINKAFADLNVAPQARAETFNLEQVQLLYKHLNT
ncbi:MAG: ribosomal RNA small subunit methyltransferase A [Bdellovibrionales bacterium GWA2_49_15]|nr:MAG: ribosomal RNA small subunit methyltransferase A [Bdellovibrionales bacterium GWA2_49_15]HAZ14392.1 ribosomal RNA small subunit methyltransferase A [Bdellovibrionales bacterium]